MPPVNQMLRIGEHAAQPWLPTDLLYCRDCHLVQLSLIADKEIVFPKDYPYTSGTTKLLRDNFQDLQRECEQVVGLGDDDLVVDIGSNDGTLLSYFQSGGQKVIAIEPTDVADMANGRGIPTVKKFFDRDAVSYIRSKYKRAKLVTMANCFAHIDNVHSVVDNVENLLTDDGVFVTESHDLESMVDGLQFDAIYHEHLRYYSLTSLKKLFGMHGMHIFRVKRIPTHGGSIRVYASKARKSDLIDHIADAGAMAEHKKLLLFADKVKQFKLLSLEYLTGLKLEGKKIVGISAPSRAATLINYLGLDEDIIDYVCEVKGSLKIGRYMPGTQIPIYDEEILFRDQPDCALILSWHIADELMTKLRGKGYKGSMIPSLPEMKIAA